MIPLSDDNPSQLRPVVTIGLIVTCIVVFLWQLGHDPDASQALVYAYGLVPSVLFHISSLPPEVAVVPPALTVVTSMFLHGGWLHLIGNMLYLWIFGDNVEDSMGHARFIVFYLLCGVTAALTQAIPDPQSDLPMIGASGAISGVLGAYLLLFPRARVLVLVPIVFIFTTLRLPAAFVLGLWFLLQALNGLYNADAGGGVAFRAHIGGFVAGMALVMLFKRPGFRPMWMH
jgi:membrane associated rhomboid family serine protease